MKVQTFMGKASMEALAQMDHHINDWLARNHITPLHIKQTFGMGRHHDGRSDEPILIISVWYEEPPAPQKRHEP